MTTSSEIPTLPTAKSGDLSLAYETFGDPGDPALLLIMGLGAQMIGWPEDLCRQLAQEGLHVIRFDNRDAGLSTHLHEAGRPDLRAVAKHEAQPPYTLTDMAADAIAVLDALGIEQAHIAGGSMGGMIAQEVAIEYPGRVLTLTSIFSTPASGVGKPTPEAQAALTGPPATTVEEAGQRAVQNAAVFGSTGFPLDEERVVWRAQEQFRRANDPAGFARQLAAIYGSRDRRPGLAAVSVPTLVIHGEADTLVQPEGGQATADAVPGARLVTYPGMGHDLPAQLWPDYVKEISALVRSV
ncbi:alpha/beta fold hydrolase [Nocardioides insulae]|uniref:alpha/beta fold hydrolase n=1 Tax=Nocardioides insulae TaxID=394734 RepID=UPI000417E6B9|nr:alpha/beta hydrolase [Nocardioides insulae]